MSARAPALACPTCGSPVPLERRAVERTHDTYTSCRDPWHGMLPPDLAKEVSELDVEAAPTQPVAAEAPGSLTAAALIEVAREEWEALGLMSYHEDEFGHWLGDLQKEDVQKIRGLIDVLAHALEQADGHLRQLRTLADEVAGHGGRSEAADDLVTLVAAVRTVTGPACEHEWAWFAGPRVGGELCLRCMAIRAQEVNEPDDVAAQPGPSGSLTPGAVLFEEMRQIVLNGATTVSMDDADARELLAEYDRLR